MTLPKPSANTLIDQTFLGQMVDEINTISTKFTNAASPIYDTSTKKSSLTYFGGFTFATTQLDITQTLKASGTSIHTQDFIFGNGKTFLTAPLVFATIETDSVTGTGSTVSTLLNGVVVSAITTNGGTISIVLDADSRKPTVKYRVNIMAIGLPPL